MINELEIREGETPLEHHKRLVFGKLLDKSLSDQDYTELSKYVYNQELSSDVCRREMYGSKYTLKLMEQNTLNSIQENIIDTEGDLFIQKITKAKEELYKEKVKLQDERRQYNAFVRNEARWEEIKEVIESEARILNDTKPLLSNNISLKQGEQIASLLISDLHIGIDVDTYLNTYNVEIAKQYLKTLELKAIRYCKIHNVKELNLEILGDLISGVIHITTRLYQQENVINQTMICAEILSEMIHNLSKEIEKINVYFSVGNHSRVMQNYKEHLSEENFEYLILWHLKTRLKDVNNIEFKENIYDDEMIVYEVFNKKIIGVHGHKDKPESAVMSLSKMLGILFDECHCGHYHQFAFKNKTLTNGSFVGLDQFAQDHRYSGQPSQVMKIYYENGDECIYEIGLKN